MKHNSLLLALVLLLNVGSALAWKPEIGETPKPITSVEYLDGTAIDLKRFQGKPLVIYFGGDWCVNCVQDGMPAMISVSKKYLPKGLQVLYVNTDDNAIREAKSREAQSHGWQIAMPKLADWPVGKYGGTIRDMGEFGRIFGYPTTVLVDASGVVREKFQGGRAHRSGVDEAVGKLFQ